MVNERGERDETLKIRRVLVAMDASPHSRAALEAAIELASHFEAELRGLFVEDINMLRAVGLPFSRVLGQFSASWRPIDAREIERRLRTRARQIQRLFRELTERSTLSTSFHVARGTVAREILAAAQEADVLVLGRVGWSQTREWRLGSTARVACTEAAPTMTLVIRQGQPLTTPVLVPYDGAPIGGLALRLGGMLVRGLHGPLQVLLLPTKEQDVPGTPPSETPNASLAGGDPRPADRSHSRGWLSQPDPPHAASGRDDASRYLPGRGARPAGPHRAPGEASRSGHGGGCGRGGLKGRREPMWKWGMF